MKDWWEEWLEIFLPIFIGVGVVFLIIMLIVVPLTLERVRIHEFAPTREGYVVRYTRRSLTYKGYVWDEEFETEEGALAFIKASDKKFYRSLND